MQKKIKVMRQAPSQAVVVDVDFPVYAKHDLMMDAADHVVFMRWCADGNRTRITRRISYFNGTTAFDCEVENFPIDVIGLHGDENYTLGKGQYASSAEEFDAVLAEATKFLADALRKPE